MPHAPHTTRPLNIHPRTGTTLVETLVAGILLTTVVVLVGPLLLRSGQLRKMAAQRQLATQIASNCLERLTAGENPQAASHNVVQGWDMQRWLPDMKTGVTIRDDDGRPRATVTIDWTTSTGQTARPVRLTGWLPADPEAPP